MQIYPAIDIRRGRVARATGDDIVPGPDPLRLAADLLAAGASWLHVVDLDRAFATGREHDAIVRSLCALEGARVQLGGLLQRPADVAHALALGAARVVIATAGAADSGTLAQLARANPPDVLAVNLDVRGGRLARRDSPQPFDVTPAELLGRVCAAGIRVVVYRDLDQDGTLGGADVQGAAALLGRGAEIILAGGIASVEQLRGARDAGFAGVIVGRALQEGRLSLQEALTCSR